MNLLHHRLDGWQAIVVIVIVWTLPWAFVIADTASGRISLAERHGIVVDAILVYIGAALAMCSPLLALIGCGIVRQYGHRKAMRVVGTVACIAVGLVLGYVGFQIMAIACPVHLHGG
jgi:hypothetical protein